MVKLSIIVNAGSFVEKTLNSLLNQTFDDFEVICIGNNSAVGKFRDDLKFNDSGDIFGEYVTFLSSGDVFCDNLALEKINKKFKDFPQMISYGSQDKIISPNDYSNSIYVNKNIFNTAFLKDKDIKFPELTQSSCLEFISKVLSRVDKINQLEIDFDANLFEMDGIDNLLKAYKSLLDTLKYDEVIYQFREHILDIFDNLGIENLNVILDSLENNLDDYPLILRNFKEYLYFRYKDNPKFNNQITLTKNPSMPRISVLIPVYNAENFLDESINSLLNQSFDDFELICVNDGSRDNSLKMLNGFAKKDERVKVFNKENGGCGSARNRALDEASGEYIYFFDPDDLLPSDTFEEVYKSAVFNLVDMVIFKANIFDENGIRDDEIFFKLYKNLKQNDYERFTFNYKDVDDFIVGGGFAPWAKLYKKEFLDSYDDFRFNIGLAFDDVPFHVKSMVRAKRLAYVNKILYHYRVDNVNSVNSTSSNGFDIFKIIDIVKEFLINEGVFEEFEKRFYIFQINHTLAYIISTNSEKYFNIARERFLKIKDENITKNREKYELVINSESFDEFKGKFFDFELNRLKNNYNKLLSQNNNLKKENRKLRKLNNELFSSKSWKLTKPFRKITGIIKK